MLLWHGDRDLQGVDAVIVPGGFSYGDYLRAGAIARFAPVMDEVAEFAREGGLVLGICNGFQVLCEAHLLPGALLPNDSLKFIFRQVELEVVNADTAFTGACQEGDRLSIPVKHTTGRFYAPDDELDRLEASGQVVLRYAPGHNPNGSRARHRRGAQRARQRVRADAPPRARGRSADRFHGRPEDLRVDASVCRRPGPRLAPSTESSGSPTTSTS